MGTVSSYGADSLKGDSPDCAAASADSLNTTSTV